MHRIRDIGRATSRIVLTALLLIVGSYGMPRSLGAQAQDCHTFIPACPPAPPPTVRVQATTDTVRGPSNVGTVTFTVTGTTGDPNGQATVTVNGQAATSVTWSYDSNRWNVSGTATVALNAGTTR